MLSGNGDHQPGVYKRIHQCARLIISSLRRSQSYGRIQEIKKRKGSYQRSKEEKIITEDPENKGLITVEDLILVLRTQRKVILSKS